MAPRMGSQTHSTYKIVAYVHAHEMGPRVTKEYMEMLQNAVKTALKEMPDVTGIQGVEVLKQVRRKT